MKLSPVSKAILVALLTCGVGAKPTDNLYDRSHPSEALQPRQNVDWSFQGYQNGRCTGEADSYSGADSTDCRAGVFLNGGILGYTKTFLEDNCDVGFYDDDDCNNLIGLIEPGTDNACHPLAPDTAVAYQVTCS